MSHLRQEVKMQTYKVPKGTIVKLNGIPLQLLDSVNVTTTKENYKLSLSQDEHLSLNPVQAPTPLDLRTNSESLESM